MSAHTYLIDTRRNRPAAMQSWSQAAILILALFVISRIVMYGVFGFTKADFGADTFMRSLCQWDCGWYLHTARKGYDLVPGSNARGDAANWAFFPLYPMLVSAVWRIFSISPLLAGLLVSNAAALLSGFVAARLLKNFRSLLTFCVILYFGPFSFYFASVYTEALFLLLTLICLYFLSRQQYLAAGVAAAFLSGTRAVGVFMVLVIVGTALCDHLSKGRSFWSFPRAALANPQLVLAVFVAPLGLFAYMAYLHFHMGDALAFSHIQRGWDRVLGNPLTLLVKGLGITSLRRLLNGGMAQWCALWSLLGLIGAGYLMRLRRFPEAVFVLICLLIPLSTGLDSMPRYVIGLAPLLLVSSELISTNRKFMMFALPMLALANTPLLIWWAQEAGFLI